MLDDVWVPSSYGGEKDNIGLSLGIKCGAACLSFWGKNSLNCNCLPYAFLKRMKFLVFSYVLLSCVLLNSLISYPPSPGTIQNLWWKNTKKIKLIDIDDYFPFVFYFYFILFYLPKLLNSAFFTFNFLLRLLSFEG